MLATHQALCRLLQEVTSVRCVATGWHYHYCLLLVRPHSSVMPNSNSAEFICSSVWEGAGRLHARAKNFGIKPGSPSTQKSNPYCCCITFYPYTLIAIRIVLIYYYTNVKSHVLFIIMLLLVYYIYYINYFYIYKYIITLYI